MAEDIAESSKSITEEMNEIKYQIHDKLQFLEMKQTDEKGFVSELVNSMRNDNHEVN